MSQVIIYQNPNGPNVCVCTPTGDIPIELVLEKDCPLGAIIVDDSVLPKGVGIIFFDAWELKENLVTVNIDKAKTITKDRLRSERAPLLQEQDVAFQRALESGADTAAIVAEKQRLRDITKLVDTVTTLDELNALSTVMLKLP
jgi:hypothetical protein